MMPIPVLADALEAVTAAVDEARRSLAWRVSDLPPDQFRFALAEFDRRREAVTAAALASILDAIRAN